ncbi:MAG: hypothetical protein IJT35_01170 [Paludibacteraceae bacterium]|nr:hypothetical protein [Paludibacteraceae bacterium]
MKKVLLASLVALLVLSSCSALKGTSSNANTVASAVSSATSSDGMAAGQALSAIYKQYKADGKYDYTNLNNALNTIKLLQSCQNLKSNAKNSTYWKNFAAGLVLGSNNLVTDQLSGTVTNSLNSLVSNVDTQKLQSAGQNATDAISTAKQTASSISNILSLFK